MIFLLNAPVLTAYGTFKFEHIELIGARELLTDGFQSFIGHQSSCDILSQLLEIPIPLNRGQYEQKPGDKALIFRLQKRIDEGQVLNSVEEIEKIGYEFGLLTKIK